MMTTVIILNIPHFWLEHTQYIIKRNYKCNQNFIRQFWICAGLSLFKWPKTIPHVMVIFWSLLSWSHRKLHLWMIFLNWVCLVWNVYFSLYFSSDCRQMEPAICVFVSRQKRWYIYIHTNVNVQVYKRSKNVQVKWVNLYTSLSETKSTINFTIQSCHHDISLISLSTL